MESSESVESMSEAIVVSSPTAQLHTPRVQMMLVQLLQRAAHTPEELLLFVSELGTAGLLSPDVVTGLCRDAGVGVGMLNAIRSGASAVDLNAAAATAASGAARLVGRSGAPSSLFQALPGSSSKSLGGAGIQQQQAAALPSPYAAANFGLGLSIDAGVAMPQDRLSTEFCDFQKIGQGGGGLVFRARHRLDGREYALKRVAFWLRAAAPDHAPRVLREALALARLDHPHICRYYTAWLQTDWRSLQTKPYPYPYHDPHPHPYPYPYPYP